MHYYKRNIGEYAKKAGKLSLLQHGVYTLLIDACYDRERFPTEDEAIDWVWAESEEEIAAVKYVLKKFFTLENGVFVQNRIAEELDAYQQTVNNNKRIALEREAKKAERHRGVNEALTVNDNSVNESLTERSPEVHEPPPKQEPLTKNQYKPPIRPKGQVFENFEKFWKAYPRRTARVNAVRAFEKLNPDDPLLEKIITALEAQKKSLDWRKDGGKFIPHPATWINARRWEDELPLSQPLPNNVIRPINFQDQNAIRELTDLIAMQERRINTAQHELKTGMLKQKDYDEKIAHANRLLDEYRNKLNNIRGDNGENYAHG